MSAQLAHQEWFESMLAHNRSQPVDSTQRWLNQTREAARQQIAQLPIPQRKQEAWRYTDLSGLYEQMFYMPPTPVTALDDDDIEHWIYPAAESYRLVFANGQCVPALSNIQSIPHKLKLGSLRAALSTDGKLVSDALTRQHGHAPDVFTELNRALLDDGLFIHIPANVELDLPIEVMYLNLSVERETLSQPYSLVILEENARATLIEHFISTGDSNYFFNGISQLQLGRHAVLDHYRLQDESRQAYHLSRVGLQQAASSTYRGMQITTGGAWSRSDIDVHFDGAHAECELRGINTIGTQQYSDVHLDIHHAQPACRSRQDFRNIVHGKGRAVFDGRIVVEKDAQKSDAMLSNKNLLLSEDAEVDTKPQLEIYADDVKCGHGTTVGKIDPAQIFYLRSRGISEAAARRMLCLGFAEQILAQVTESRLHDFLSRQIAMGLAHEDSA